MRNTKTRFSILLASLLALGFSTLGNVASAHDRDDWRDRDYGHHRDYRGWDDRDYRHGRYEREYREEPRGYYERRVVVREEPRYYERERPVYRDEPSVRINLPLPPLVLPPLIPPLPFHIRIH